MRKYFFLTLFLSLIQPLQVNAENEVPGFFIGVAGSNIPVTYTGTTTTGLYNARLRSYNNANCTGTVQAEVTYNLNPFIVHSGTYTIYLSTTNGSLANNLAKMLCPSGTTSQYVKLPSVRSGSNSGPLCTVNTNCFTMTCSGTGQVATGTQTGTMPTIRCT